MTVASVNLMTNVLRPVLLKAVGSGARVFYDTPDPLRGAAAKREGTTLGLTTLFSAGVQATRSLFNLHLKPAVQLALDIGAIVFGESVGRMISPYSKQLSAYMNQQKAEAVQSARAHEPVRILLANPAATPALLTNLLNNPDMFNRIRAAGSANNPFSGYPASYSIPQTLPTGQSVRGFY